MDPGKETGQTLDRKVPIGRSTLNRRMAATGSEDSTPGKSSVTIYTTAEE
jgi:type IV secretory pathway ATPase VirB11/archaellum biosynthesis ATPase